MQQITLEHSKNTPWYKGPNLMAHLEAVELDKGQTTRKFPNACPMGNRPNLDFRGFSGKIAEGSISPNDEVLILPLVKAE